MQNTPAYKLHFRLADVFPPGNPLSVPLLRMMMAANDVRHIQKLKLSTGERIDGATDFDKVVNGELLHLHRLLVPLSPKIGLGMNVAVLPCRRATFLTGI